MEAVVMCGGRGTRLDAPVEKPLLAVCGERMIDGVLAGLADAPVDRVICAVSPHTPETATHLREHPQAPWILETPGDGYVADLQFVLERVGPPVVSTAADLPLLTGAHVTRAIDAVRRQSASLTPAEQATPSLTVCVPVELKRQLGASVDETIPHERRKLAPTGLNVVGDGDGEIVEVVGDRRLAVNVNRPADVAAAEALCD